MRVTCWVSKVKNTHSELVIIIAFPRQQWLQKRAYILCYTYTVCLVFHTQVTACQIFNSNSEIKLLLALLVRNIFFQQETLEKAISCNQKNIIGV